MMRESFITIKFSAQSKGSGTGGSFWQRIICIIRNNKMFSIMKSASWKGIDCLEKQLRVYIVAEKHG